MLAATWKDGGGELEMAKDNFLDHPSLLEHLSGALKPASRRWMAGMGKSVALNYLGRSEWARGERGGVMLPKIAWPVSESPGL